MSIRADEAVNLDQNLHNTSIIVPTGICVAVIRGGGGAERVGEYVFPLGADRLGADKLVCDVGMSRALLFLHL